MLVKSTKIDYFYLDFLCLFYKIKVHITPLRRFFEYHNLRNFKIIPSLYLEERERRRISSTSKDTFHLHAKGSQSRRGQSKKKKIAKTRN